MKKRETVAVTNPDTQWRAVQDPETLALYYKNQETGEMQWEEPDALAKIQLQASAHASLHASELYEQLNDSRESLAQVLESDRDRQRAELRAKIQKAKSDLRAQMQERASALAQEQVRALLHHPTSLNHSAGAAGRRTASQPELETLCQENPSLEIFMSSNYKPPEDSQPQMSPEKRLPHGKCSMI